MKISEVAKAADVNVQTLRYYERRGLLPEPPRSVSGHRIYDHKAVRIIRFIKSAQSLGFSLSEIDQLLSFRDPAVAERDSVRELTEKQLRDVEERIAKLSRLRLTLQDLLDNCSGSETLSCPILESLEQPER